jgi:DNA-binding response OmpR family regulator
MPMYAILCVTEDPVKQEALSVILRSNGYVSLSAETASEAVAMAKCSAIDMVIIDHDLKSVDSFELTGTLKTLREIPVISIGSKDNIIWNREGGDLLITFPIYPTELVRAIELFCSRRAPAMPSHVA